MHWDASKPQSSLVPFEYHPFALKTLRMQLSKLLLQTCCHTAPCLFIVRRVLKVDGIPPKHPTHVLTHVLSLLTHYRQKSLNLVGVSSV